MESRWNLWPWVSDLPVLKSQRKWICRQQSFKNVWEWLGRSNIKWQAIPEANAGLFLGPWTQPVAAGWPTYNKLCDLRVLYQAETFLSPPRISYSLVNLIRSGNVAMPWPTLLGQFLSRYRQVVRWRVGWQSKWGVCCKGNTPLLLVTPPRSCFWGLPIDPKSH